MATKKPKIETPETVPSTIATEQPTAPVEIKDPFKQAEKPAEQPSPDLLAKLVEDMAEMKEQNKMLLQIADKTQLARFYSKNTKKLPGIIKLNYMMVGEQPKVIMAWRMTKNDVHKDALTQRWQEIQEVELAYEDGTTQRFAYTDYVRQYLQTEATILSSTKDSETDNLILKVARISDGKEYLIDVRFVN